MVVSPFFSNYTHMSEQTLWEDLVIESIRIFGLDVFYIKRTDGAIDRILNEDDIPTYEDAYQIEMYVKNVDGFAGEGDFLSKFGIQVRDQMTMVCARKVFERGISAQDSERPRPMEGDLIWLPFCRKMFEITFVEHEAVFYQGGKLQSYEIRMELFEWSHDEMGEIDDILGSHMVDRYDTSEVDSLEDLADIDPIANNKDFYDKEQEIVDFSEKDPFSEEITWVKREDE